METNLTGEISIGRIESVKTLAVRRANMQAWLAISMTIMIGVLATLSLFAAIVYPDRFSAIKDMISFILGPLIGIYATIVGFYFGAKSHD